MANIDSIMTGIALAVVLGCAGAWLGALPRLARREPLLPYEPRRHVPWGLFDLLSVVALWFGGQFVAAVVLKEQFGIDVRGDLAKATPDARAALLFSGALAQLIAVALGVLIVALRKRCTWRDVGIDLHRVPHDLKLGLIAFIMLAPPVFAIQATLVYVFKMPSVHPLIELLKQDTRFFWMSGFLAVIAAPLCEEYVVRVLLQGWLEKVATWRGSPMAILFGGVFDRFQPLPEEPPGKANDVQKGADEDDGIGAQLAEDRGEQLDQNPYLAPLTSGRGLVTADTATADDPAQAPPVVWPMFVSALVFALLHWSHGPDPVALFVLALGLGYLYQRTHRALPCIIVHLLLNGTTMVMLYVQLYLIEAPK